MGYQPFPMIFLRNNFRLVYNWSEFDRWSIICNIDSIILKKQAIFTGFLLNIIWIVNGLFGDEEIREIIPAVSEWKTMGFNVEGPIAPDTVFLRCYKGEYDLVVAMYHDQGHIPLKLADFDGGHQHHLRSADHSHICRPWHRLWYRRHQQGQRRLSVASPGYRQENRLKNFTTEDFIHKERWSFDHLSVFYLFLSI